MAAANTHAQVPNNDESVQSARAEFVHFGIDPVYDVHLPEGEVQVRTGRRFPSPQLDGLT